MKRMIKPLRITPTAFDSRVSVMQAAEVGGEVEKFRVEEDGLERGLKKQQVTERTGELALFKGGCAHQSKRKAPNPSQLCPIAQLEDHGLPECL